MYIFFLGFIFITVGIWFYYRGCKIEKQKLEEIENKYREQIKKISKKNRINYFKFRKILYRQMKSVKMLFRWRPRHRM